MAAGRAPEAPEVSPPAPSAAARAQQAEKKAEYAPSEVIVRYAAGVSEATKRSVDKKAGAVAAKRLGHLVPGLTKVKLRPGMPVEAAIAVYEKQPGVLYAEPNYKGGIDAEPNDPEFSALWGLHNTGQEGGVPDADIDAPEAWDLTTGSSDVLVAVIDTGVDYTHPDLADNMWRNPGEVPDNGIDDDANGYVDDVYGIDTYNDDSDPFDDHSHGTHCAGTIGAVGDNALGVAGVNWDVTIMAVKWIGADGMGWTDDAIEAIEYAYRMGADLSSNSWHIFEYSQAMYDTIEALGRLIVFAAGNDGSDTDIWTNHPSAYDPPNIVAVGASNRYDQPTGWSNYGLRTVDVFAPGEDVLSTVPGEGYAYYSGTSMATPHVAGVAALLLSAHPTASWQSVKLAIMAGSDQLAALQGLCMSGGRLNAASALQAIEAEPGSVIGTVRSAQTGEPIVGATVAVGGTVSTLTDVEGAYAIADVVPGTQSVICSHPDYISKVVTVSIPPAGVATLDIELDLAAKISGTVTSASTGLPIEGIQVTAWAGSDRGMIPAGQAFTAADGTYVIGGLVADPQGYRVEFYDPTLTYVPEFYNDKASAELADPVFVEPGVTTAGIDAALIEFGRITGTVTSESDGAPLGNVWVTAYRQYPDGYWGPWAGTVTAADGTYTLGGLEAGAYRIEFAHMSGDYAYEYYRDASTLRKGQTIRVALGSVVSGIDAALGPAGKIAGTVVAARTGAPLGSVYVSVYRNEGGTWSQVMFGAETAPDGSYAVGGLPTGVYRVEFNDWSGEYTGEFYQNRPDLRSATAVAVRAGTTRSGIDAELDPAGYIAGLVTAAADGAPLENVWVLAYKQVDKEWYPVRDALTGPDGTYMMGGLPAGTYRVFFMEESGSYASEYYNGRLTLESADDVIVRAGEVTPDIDASLEPAAHISGTVTDAATGEPLQGVWVTAYRKVAKGWEPWWGAETRSDGTYSIDGLMAGTYRLEFADYWGGHAFEFYENKTSIDLATDLVLSVGTVASGIDAQLEPGGRITGTVVDPKGVPLQYVMVVVYRLSGGVWEPWSAVETARDGTYAITGLATGTYRVGFTDWTGQHSNEFYNDKPTLKRADGVAVIAGQDTSGINAVLEPTRTKTRTLAEPVTRPQFGPERWLGE